MDFKQATFTAAYGTASQLPASLRPEVSFAGRSNVGKSSLINALCSKKDLVKVSQTPGKTTTINFFRTGAGAGSKPDAGIDIVDLPGYGFAKVSQAERDRWSELMDGYFNQNRLFALVVCLVDIRHDAQALDIQMLNYVEEMGLPYCVALTKGDKLSRQQQLRQAAALRKQLEVPADVPVIVTSAQTGAGMDTLRAAITAAADAVR